MHVHVRFCCFLLLVLSGSGTLAQPFYSAGVSLHRSAAQFSDSYSDPLYSLGNPALVTDSQRLMLAAHFEKKYMTEELNVFVLAASKKIADDACSVGYVRFGNHLFYDQNVSVSYAKTLGKTNAGIQVGYRSSRAGVYKLFSGISTAVAAIFSMSQNAVWSFKAVNLHSLVSIKDSTRLRPSTSFHAGAGYQASGVYLGIELIKQERRNPYFCGLFVWKLEGNFLLRASLATHSGEPFFSVTWKKSAWTLEAGIAYHVVLGVSPSFTFILAYL
jgi:hypothetical protein